MPPQQKTPYMNVAVVTKTQGLKGQVVIESITGCPFAVPEGAELYFTPPPLRGMRSAILEQADITGTTALLSFAGIDDIGAAEAIVGKTLLAKRADLDATQGDRRGLVGREVVCATRGLLGSIEEILITPANDVWVVRGSFGEVLIPVHGQVVIDIPEQPDAPVMVDLPYGLLDSEAVLVDGDNAYEDDALWDDASFAGEGYDVEEGEL